ncbi:MAG: sterol desaturase family protein [Flavobacteriaceae bacterium]|jgi:alkylglycerol monooxygenase|nr:sterol desaturase family protein [Flavobacteriaceae bacterium]MBT4313467.1 sterol desaturase family protein [Flavobacteriaceae bacterium]MBT5090920.1 sterol desaturase family protein [Flavobacteriaceae bacterium]MBT5283604.1 sterol desaturase family protein [Flavobacteriaceae bacterium]MBT5447011.1 sterol desaturase family protein [Flavobacteriaceae bacterium]
MDTYAAVLLWAIPAFFVLVLIEISYGHFTKKQTYTFMDTLSSLSSGMTNVIKDALGLAVILISYPFVLKYLAIFQLESSVFVYITAFICIDFASYWVHRLNHKVNIFWNQHVIHHSSEEFNLACALRQSISNLIGFGAVFLIPAALLGVPAKVIMSLAPLHLFAQFWYHTQHIGKLGFLEYILVTPSQHRVHHAINPIYIDKNMAAIFSVWDRLFGTFQEELDSEPPVYGTLKPSKSWNPIWINFQHLWQITQDAWYAKNWIDKLKIWFMPTGWRPKDVEDRFPITPRPIDSEDKYNPFYNNQWKAIALIHFVSLNFLLLFLLANYSELTVEFRVSLGFVLLFSIFGFTGLMDFHKWAPTYEIFRGLLGILFVFLPQCEFLRFEYPLFFGFYITYFIITSALGIWSNRKEFNRSLAL